MLHFEKSFKEKAGINFQEYKKIVEEICNELQINDVDIFFEAVPYIFSAQASPVKNMLTGEFYYSVQFNSIQFTHDISHFYFVAAHELRHVHQFNSNLLSKHCVLMGTQWDEQTVCTVYLWNKKMYYFCKSTQFDVPWESDANFYAIEYLDRKNVVIDDNDKDSFWGKTLNHILEYYGTKYNINKMQNSTVPYYSSMYNECINSFKEVNYEIED